MDQTYLTVFATTVVDSFQTVWVGLLRLLPNVIAAILVLIIGWLLASALGKLVRRAVEFTKVDEAINQFQWDRSLKEAGIEFNLARLFGWLAKWFVIIVVLIAVAEILRLQQITAFLETVALYIPNIIIAVVILLIGFVLGNFVHNVVYKSILASKVSTAAGLVAAVAKWAIVVFAFLAALTHLNIARELIHTLFTAFVGMLALAGGLAFGLGGKDAARDMLEKIRREIQ